MDLKHFVTVVTDVTDIFKNNFKIDEKIGVNLSFLLKSLIWCWLFLWYNYIHIKHLYWLNKVLWKAKLRQLKRVLKRNELVLTNLWISEVNLSSRNTSLSMISRDFSDFVTIQKVNLRWLLICGIMERGNL